MTTFKDNAGHEWQLSLDAFTLGELRDAKNIDLADTAGLDYARCERDPATLVAALAVLCGDERKAESLSERDFAKRLTGDTLDAAWESLWRAAKVFFPAKLWSALESNLDQHRAMEAARPMLAALSQPGMPAEMREVVMGQVASMLSSGDLQSSTGNPSVTAPDATPSSSASEPPAALA